MGWTLGQLPRREAFLRFLWKNGKHTYNGSALDLAVQAWQRNGVHIMASLRFFSS